MSQGTKTAKTTKMAKKGRYMSNEEFGKLKSAFEDALAFERGQRADLRVTRVPLPAAPRPISPARVVRIRQHLNFSQAMFAKLLNVSPRTIQDWEQGRRTPSDAALKLLVVAEKHPEVLIDT